MRKMFKLIRYSENIKPRTTVDRSPADHAETMGFKEHSYQNRQDLVGRQLYQNEELHQDTLQALRMLLDKDQSVLSIGSGDCEVELPLFLEGYRMTASDLCVEAAHEVRRLFPQFPFRQIDALGPPVETRYDALFLPSIEFLFDSREMDVVFSNFHKILKAHGRVLFTLSLRQTWGTALVDFMAAPIFFVIFNVSHWIRHTGFRYTFKQQGWRRTSKDIEKLASKHGFTIRRIFHTGHGDEFRRFYIDKKLPWLFEKLKAMDSCVHRFNSRTIYELCLP